MKNSKDCKLQSCLKLEPGDLVEAQHCRHDIYFIHEYKEYKIGQGRVTREDVVIDKPVYMIFIGEVNNFNYRPEINMTVSQFLFGDRIVHICETDKAELIKSIYTKIIM